MTIVSRCPPEVRPQQEALAPQNDAAPMSPSARTDDAIARLTVSLPRNLLRQFRLHALEQDITLSALLARLIREELGSA
jgi:hypothetical protein